MQFKIKEPKNPKEIIFTGNNYYTFSEGGFEEVKDIDIDFFKCNKLFSSEEFPLEEVKEDKKRSKKRGE